jgi:hypothetical protein
VHIVLPALRHSILSGLIIVAALSIGGSILNLISDFPAEHPVVLLQAFYGATGFACAATVILLALALTASTSVTPARSADRFSRRAGMSASVRVEHATFAIPAARRASSMSRSTSHRASSLFALAQAAVARQLLKLLRISAP